MSYFLIRIISLIVIPFIIAFFIFFPKEIPISINQQDNKTFIGSIPDFAELVEESDFKRLMMTIFSAPFDLKYYVITIKDTSEYNGPKGGLGYHLFLDGKKLDFLKASGEIKTKVLTDKQHEFELVTRVQLSRGDAPTGSEVSFTIKFDVSTRPSYWDVVAKIFLFIVAVNGIFLLFKEIWNFIKS